MTDILIIDDVEGVRELMKEIIKEIADYHVDTAENGLIGLEMMNEKEYSLVFLDIKMPGLSGYDVIREIRKKGYKCKVIAISTIEMMPDKDELKEFGFDGSLLKPFENQDLIDIALKHLGKS